MLSRTLFYSILVLVALFGLLIYGASLTNVFSEDVVFWTIFLYVASYLLLWLVLYYFILNYGKSTISNTLQMIGVWLLFVFIIPAAIQQRISIEKPTNLMIDLIDAKRDETDKIYAQSSELTDQQLFNLYPSLKEAKVRTDATRLKRARRSSIVALINIVMKDATASIEEDNQSKNSLISKTYWFNPVTYFQNELNRLSQTHYEDYQAYRNKIQDLVDKRIEIMVLDIWNEVEVDKTKYIEYNTIFNK